MTATKMGKFVVDESGATAVEYGLLAALIAVAIIGTFSVLGNSVQGLFNNGTASTLDNQTAKIN